jgi:hypothetical protein
MAIFQVLSTTTAEASPLDASAGTPAKAGVSDFLTIQSFANFGAMTGAITAAWHALQVVWPGGKVFAVPYGLALAWGIISVLMSLEGLKTDVGGVKKLQIGNLAAAIFIAIINALVLAGAVVGTGLATTPASGAAG